MEPRRYCIALEGAMLCPGRHCLEGCAWEQLPRCYKATVGATRAWEQLQHDATGSRGSHARVTSISVMMVATSAAHRLAPACHAGWVGGTKILLEWKRATGNVVLA